MILTIKLDEWQGVPCFFAAGERSNIPFDIFSASFYVLSRYEEYLPHVKDNFGRFSAKTSFLFKAGVHRRPLVDLWSNLLLKELQERFPDIKPKSKKYAFRPLVKVSTSHQFKYRDWQGI